MPVNRLGQRLEAERARRDITLTEFAQDVLGIEQSLVSRYINGRLSPGRRNARKIAQALGLDPAEMAAWLEEGETRRGAPASLEQDRELIRAVVRETLAEVGLVPTPPERPEPVCSDDPDLAAWFRRYQEVWARMTPDERRDFLANERPLVQRARRDRAAR